MYAVVGPVYGTPYGATRVDQESINKTVAAARYLVAEAKRGAPLANYRDEGATLTQGNLWQPPRTPAEAYANAAGWMALVSRLAKSSRLANDAEGYLAQATNPAVARSRDDFASVTILKDSIEQIHKRTGSKATTKGNPIYAIVSTLSRHAGIETIRETQEMETEKELVTQASGSEEDTFTTAANVLDWTRNFLPWTDPKNPANQRDWKWYYTAGIAAGGVIVLAVVLRPYLKAAEKTAGAASRGVKKASESARRGVARAKERAQRARASQYRRNRYSRNRATRRNRR